MQFVKFISTQNRSKFPWVRAVKPLVEELFYQFFFLKVKKRDLHQASCWEEKWYFCSSKNWTSCWRGWNWNEYWKICIQNHFFYAICIWWMQKIWSHITNLKKWNEAFTKDNADFKAEKSLPNFGYDNISLKEQLSEILTDLPKISFDMLWKFVDKHGRKPKMLLVDQLFMFLVWLKNGLNLDFTSWLFNSNMWINAIIKVHHH